MCIFQCSVRSNSNCTVVSLALYCMLPYCVIVCGSWTVFGSILLQSVQWRGAMWEKQCPHRAPRSRLYMVYAHYMRIMLQISGVLGLNILCLIKFQMFIISYAAVVSLLTSQICYLLLTHTETPVWLWKERHLPFSAMLILHKKLWMGGGSDVALLC